MEQPTGRPRPVAFKSAAAANPGWSGRFSLSPPLFTNRAIPCPRILTIVVLLSSCWAPPRGQPAPALEWRVGRSADLPTQWPWPSRLPARSACLGFDYVPGLTANTGGGNRHAVDRNLDGSAASPGASAASLNNYDDVTWCGLLPRRPARAA
jgi:hypothetical protein